MLAALDLPLMHQRIDHVPVLCAEVMLRASTCPVSGST